MYPRVNHCSETDNFQGFNVWRLVEYYSKRCKLTIYLKSDAVNGSSGSRVRPVPEDDQRPELINVGLISRL